MTWQDIPPYTLPSLALSIGPGILEMCWGYLIPDTDTGMSGERGV